MTVMLCPVFPFVISRHIEHVKLDGLEEAVPFGSKSTDQHQPTGSTTGVRFLTGSRDFIVSTASRPTLGSTQPPIKWASRLIPVRVERGLRIHGLYSSPIRLHDVVLN
jgi:hypothetical protein